MVNYFHLEEKKKIIWQASFQQNNEVLVLTGYIECKLQWSEQNGLQKHIYFFKTPDSYLKSTYFAKNPVAGSLKMVSIFQCHRYTWLKLLLTPTNMFIN